MYATGRKKLPMPMSLEADGFLNNLLSLFGILGTSVLMANNYELL